MIKGGLSKNHVPFQIVSRFFPCRPDRSQLLRPFLEPRNVAIKNSKALRLPCHRPGGREALSSIYRHITRQNRFLSRLAGYEVLISGRLKQFVHRVFLLHFLRPRLTPIFFLIMSFAKYCGSHTHNGCPFPYCDLKICAHTHRELGKPFWIDFH